MLAVKFVDRQRSLLAVVELVGTVPFGDILETAADEEDEGDGEDDDTGAEDDTERWRVLVELLHALNPTPAATRPTTATRGTAAERHRDTEDANSRRPSQSPAPRFDGVGSRVTFMSVSLLDPRPNGNLICGKPGFSARSLAAADECLSLQIPAPPCAMEWRL